MSDSQSSYAGGMSPRSPVPPIMAWRGFSRAFFNLLAFGLVAVAATWVVHQTEYLIEYRGRFGAVMATSSHRFYMEPAAIMLLGLSAALLIMVGLTLRRTDGRTESLLPFLPGRLARHVSASPTTVPFRAICWTALALALGQIGLYLLQENIEWLVAWGYLPGPSVLFAPQHATVVPLHMLAAFCGSVLLWATTVRLRRARQTLHMARVLSAVAARWGGKAPRSAPRRLHFPDLRIVGGILCSRAPPLSA